MAVSAIDLKKEVTERLRQVIDPETGADVIRMRLIEDLEVDAASGRVRYRFRPSSPLCPLAIPLALEIHRAISEVPGVTQQEIAVVGYVGADELNELMKEVG